MRDTNIFISAMLFPHGKAAAILLKAVTPTASAHSSESCR